MTNRIIFTFGLIVILSGMSSCSNSDNAVTKTDEISQPGTIDVNTKATATGSKSVKEMTFDRLSEYIPHELFDFKAKDAVNGENGGIGKSEARYFSFASQVYYKPGQSIRLEIVDYLMDTNQYNGLLNMFGFNSDIDNNVVKTKRIQLGIPGTKAITSEYKLENAAKLIIGAGDRFLITISSIDARDLALLQKVVGEIEIEKLIKESSIATSCELRASSSVALCAFSVPSVVKYANR